MSLKRAKLARKGFEGSMRGEVAGIILGVPRHASLLALQLISPPPPARSNIQSCLGIFVLSDPTKHEFVTCGCDAVSEFVTK